MPFPRSAYNLKSRLHISHIPTPALVGAGVLLLAALAGVAAGFVSLSGKSPAFEVVASEDAEGHSEAEEGADASAGDRTESSSEPSQGSGANQASAALPMLAVHVSGAVASPGVYELEEGSRVRDAVEAAGGFAPEASQGSVNLARKVSDGEQTLILTVEEFEASPSSSSSSGSSDADAPGSSGSGGLVNINTARRRAGYRSGYPRRTRGERAVRLDRRYPARERHRREEVRKAQREHLRMMRMLDEGVAERERVGKGDAGGAIKGAVAPRMSNAPVRPSFPLALGCALVVWAVVLRHLSSRGIAHSRFSPIGRLRIRASGGCAAGRFRMQRAGSHPSCREILRRAHSLRRLRAVHGTREGDGAGVVLRFLGGVRYALCAAGGCGVCAAG